MVAFETLIEEVPMAIATVERALDPAVDVLLQAEMAPVAQYEAFGFQMGDNDTGWNKGQVPGWIEVKPVAF